MGDTKLGRVAHAPDECVAVQSSLDRLENWTERNMAKFSKRRSASREE